MENGHGEGNESLFDQELLERIDWKQKKVSFKSDDISCTNAGEGLAIRPLNIADYDKGYMNVLSHLTSIGEVDREVFETRFRNMKDCKDTYFITVIEDTTKSKVIGSASLIVEQKFIHSAGTRGRIEDVVVNSDYRGKQLGKLLVETMTLLGKELGCYKISLECKEENFGFYESHGFSVDGQLFLVQRYKD